tara:strand:+ start:795 stop:1091 length:297 start_codon:yes stop_codon:yes gene_type:complete
MDKSMTNNIREMEKILDLDEGELDNFIHLDSISCCRVLSIIMKDITTGIAVSPAALTDNRRGEAIRDYVTTMVGIIRELRELFLEDHKHNEFTRKHLN